MKMFFYRSRQINKGWYLRAYLSAAAAYSEDFAIPTMHNYCEKQIQKLLNKKQP